MWIPGGRLLLVTILLTVVTRAYLEVVLELRDPIYRWLTAILLTGLTTLVILGLRRQLPTFKSTQPPSPDQLVRELRSS